jgi:signal transduction histidine kinase
VTQPVRPPRAADRADIEDLWTAASVARERQGFALGAIYSAVLVPLWGVFDGLLEPALLRPFLWLRAVDFLLGGVLFVALVRSRGIRAVRLFGGLRPMVSGLVIAFMCPRVSIGHYFPYILGFSLVFWAMSILHTWPARFSISLCGFLLASYFLARSLVGIDRPVVDEVAAIFYLGSTAFMCVLSVENRRRLYYQTFLVNLELNARNHELDATVRSLRETQTRLVEGEKLSALGRLIASLSHEINNPINVLRNNLQPLGQYLGQMSEVLGVGRAGGDLAAAWNENDIDFVLRDGAEALGTMSQGIARIQAIHNEMRAFVRGDAPEMQAGDLNEGLRATANMFRRSLPEAISIEVDCALIPAIRFQAGQMNQVFFNLIQNAVDAIEGAGKPGTITLRTEAEPDWVRLVVEDTGPGVSAWAREHLFEPFFTTKALGKGTGLGLATSYQIVQRHRGVIDLDTDYRSGARFVVRLPRAAEDAASSRSRAVAALAV